MTLLERPKSSSVYTLYLLPNPPFSDQKAPLFCPTRIYPIAGSPCISITIPRSTLFQFAVLPTPLFWLLWNRGFSWSCDNPKTEGYMRVRPQKRGNCLSHKIWDTQTNNCSISVSRAFKAGSLTLNSTSEKSWSNTTKVELVGISGFTGLPSSLLHAIPSRIIFCSRRVHTNAGIPILLMRLWSGLGLLPHGLILPSGICSHPLTIRVLTIHVVPREHAVPCLVAEVSTVKTQTIQSFIFESHKGFLSFRVHNWATSTKGLSSGISIRIRRKRAWSRVTIIYSLTLINEIYKKYNFF